MKEKFLKSIKDADWSRSMFNRDVADSLINDIKNDFVRGYLTAKIEDSTSDDYEEDLIEWANYDIWN